MKLVLCAGGERHIPGWKHHDVKPYPGVDYVCDIRDILTKVEVGSCDSIQFTHALEHFAKKEVPVILNLIHTLLKPGGDLYLEVPNFTWHAELVVNEGRDEDAIYYAFGGQLDEWDFHKTGFTDSILHKELAAAGFSDIQITQSSSLIARCKS